MANTTNQTITFTDDDLKVIEAVTHTMKEYDRKAYGRMYVEDEVQKGKHGKYARATVLKAILHEGGQLFISDLLESTAEMEENIRKGKGIRKPREEKPDNDYLQKVLHDPRCRGMWTSAGARR